MPSVFPEGDGADETMEEWDDFLNRLSKIHFAFHSSGDHILDCILKTSKEMLQDRLCSNIKTASSVMNEIVSGRPVLTSDSTNVFVHMEDKVGVKAARGIVDGSNGKQSVCISIDGPTSFTRNEFLGKPIQFMTCRSLCMNVTKHKLVPKHSLVTETSFDSKNLPLISEADPVVQYYNWPKGSVVKIERIFAGSEPVPYFRLISASN